MTRPGTLCKAADALKALGAKKIFAFASHGLFNDPAIETAKKSTINQIIVTNSVPLDSKVNAAFPD